MAALPVRTQEVVPAALKQHFQAVEVTTDLGIASGEEITISRPWHLFNKHRLSAFGLAPFRSSAGMHA